MFDEAFLPSQFDVLVTDVHSRDLHLDISTKLGVKYLADVECDNSSLNVIEGIVWGPYNRLFVSVTVRVGTKQPKYVHMLVDTGSPRTYISSEVFASFDRMIYNPNNPVSVSINQKQISVFQCPDGSHFNDINLLGSDYLKTFNGVLNVNYQDETVKIDMLNN